MCPARRESSSVGRRESSSRRASRSLRASASAHLRTSPGGSTPSSSRSCPELPPLSNIVTMAWRSSQGFCFRPPRTLGRPVPPPKQPTFITRRYMGGFYPGCAYNAAMRVWPGRPHPLGATWDGLGVNVALFSEHATAVDLCLFDSPADEREAHRIPLLERTDHVWHAYLPDVRPGQLYGFRVHGPYAPHAGHRFNPSKIVLDPYARAIGRQLRWHDAIFGYAAGRHGNDAVRDDLVRDDRDSAAVAPLAAVIDPAFTWGDDRRPQTPWHDTVIYELHVKGFTWRHPQVPAAAARHVPRPGVGRRPAAPDRPRGDGRRTAARAPPRQRSPPGGARPDELLGLQLARLLRARRALRQREGPHGRRARVQGDGAGAARGGPRGDSRRRLQPHGRRRSPRAHAVAAGHRQRLVLPPRARRSAPLPGLHRLRQHAEHAAPARAPAHHGQPALLGRRHARRRLPLRSRQRAGARAVRSGQAGLVLRHHPAGPDPLAGEADRRAVGPRRGRVPGGQLPRRLDRVERALSRLGAPVLARRRRAGLPAGQPPGRAAATSTPRAAGARTRASTS